MPKKRHGIKRYFGRRNKGSYRHSSSGRENTLNDILFGMGYGAGRPYIANALAPVINMLPLGNVKDEAVMGVGGFLLTKLRNPLAKKIGKTMLVVESARVGELISTGQLGIGGQSTGTGSTTF